MEISHLNFPHPLYPTTNITKMRIHEMKKGYSRFAPAKLCYTSTLQGCQPIVEMRQLLPVWVEGYDPTTNTWDEICSFRDFDDAVDWCMEIFTEYNTDNYKQNLPTTKVYWQGV